MPTYEFRCPSGHEFEKFYRSISAAPPEVLCPICGKVAERQMSAGGGLVFKGSGFYITDYGKDGKGPKTPPSPAVEGGSPSKNADAGGGKGESTSKPEAKPSEAKSGDSAKPAATEKPAAKSSSSRKGKSKE
ncbi:MAG: zinc ribbon domain-containing protein [Gemmatimonadales bacterium]